MNFSKISRLISADGTIRLIIVNTTQIVKTARTIHSMSKTMTAVLGRCLTAASLIGVLQKDKNETITLKISGNGPAGTIVCISDYMGNVRGYADNYDAELLPNINGKLDVGGAVGKGILSIIRDTGEGEPHIGISSIVSGEIAEDITEYFASSEQTPTVCSLGVLCEKNFDCRAAGGFLLQLLPGYDENMISVLEDNISKLDSISSQIDKGYNAKQIADEILNGIKYEMFDETDIEYLCPCTRDVYARAIMSLGENELRKLYHENEPVQTRCLYCGKTNIFSLDEIIDMIKALQ